MKRTIIFIITAIILINPKSIQAAFIFFDPAQTQIEPGQTLILKAKIDTKNECINAARLDIKFLPDLINVIDINRSNSIMPVWIKNPSDQDIKQANKTGVISLEGGIPGGFCGNLADRSAQNNVIVEIIFRVPGIYVNDSPNNKSAPIEFLESSQVFLNDGQGTLAPLTSQPAILEIANKDNLAKLNEWEEKIKNDNIKPEQFEIIISKNPAIDNGKYFITFSATDKQTGIDHYEISESPLISAQKDIWKIGDSPYILEDQTLQSIIKVKAVDNAGNGTISQFTPGIIAKNPPWKTILTILLALVIIGAAILVNSKKRSRHHQK